MNVQINKTDERKSLSIIDAQSGVNWVADLIGNAGAFADGQFVWSDEADAYLASQETYDWWSQYIADTEATEAEAEALADELGIPIADVTDMVGLYQGHDYDMHRMEAVQAMADLREQYS